MQHKSTPLRLILSSLVAGIFLLGAGTAQAVNISFGTDDAGFPYTEGGYQIAVLSGEQWSISDSNGNPAAALSTRDGTGTPNAGDAISITLIGGGLFDFLSFESARGIADGPGEALSDSVRIEGYVGGVLTEDPGADFDDNSLEWEGSSISWDDLVDEVRITVTQANSAALWVDNVNVVPEPTTGLLLGTGLIGMGYVGRRRRR